MDETQAFIDYWFEDHGHKLPTVWAICPDCRGDGHRHLHGYDVTEMMDEDPDFADDYRAGHYATPCVCEAGKVRDLSRNMVGEDIWAEYLAWLQDAYDLRAAEAQERAMGA